MLKHVIEIAVRRYYQVVVDDPDESMSDCEAALIGFNAAKANPSLLFPVEGNDIDEGDIEFGTYWDCFDSFD